MALAVCAPGYLPRLGERSVLHEAMSDCAAHLVDEVLPNAPVRQWVLTFPRRLRFALARESALATKVIGI